MVSHTPLDTLYGMSHSFRYIVWCPTRLWFSTETWLSDFVEAGTSYGGELLGKEMNGDRR